MRFRAELELNGKTATGIEVPPAVVEALGAGKRPPVRVTFGAYTYRTTIAVMGGRNLIPVSAEHRGAAGVSAGDMLDIDIEVDTAPREVEVPSDLAAALKSEPGARARFDAMSYTNRREQVTLIEGAKTPETRERRIAKTVAMLQPK
jgi:hypothetical protein